MRQLVIPLAMCVCCAGSTGRSNVLPTMNQPASLAETDTVSFETRLAPPRLNESVENHVFAVTGRVEAESTTTLSFLVPEAEELTATLVGRDLRWSFTAPDGVVLVPDSTEDSETYEYRGGNGMSGFRLLHPARGRWVVGIRPVSQDSSNVYAIDVELEGSAPVVAHLETIIDGDLPNARNFAKPGTPVYVRVFLTDRGNPVRDVQWDVRARPQTDGGIAVHVFDDGRHADGAAADGIAVGAFRVRSEDGGYALRATCHDPNGTQYIVLFFVDVYDVELRR